MNPPALSHVLETILYTKEISKARSFYGDVLRLSPIPGMNSPRGQGYQLGDTLLLIFALGETNEDIVDDPTKPDIKIPLHGPSEHLVEILMNDARAPTSAASNALRQHYCLSAETVEAAKQWEQYLVDKEVPILGRMEWPRGGYSVYFADPDGHVGEIGSRGIWPNY